VLRGPNQWQLSGRFNAKRLELPGWINAKGPKFTANLTLAKSAAGRFNAKRLELILWQDGGRMFQCQEAGIDVKEPEMSGRFNATRRLKLIKTGQDYC
jgi:hypothetical protein